MAHRAIPTGSTSGRMVAAAREHLVTLWAPSIFTELRASQTQLGGNRELRVGKMKAESPGGRGTQPGTRMTGGAGLESGLSVSVALLQDLLEASIVDLAGKQGLGKH